MLSLFTNSALRPVSIFRSSSSSARAYAASPSPIRSFSSLPKANNPRWETEAEQDGRTPEEEEAAINGEGEEEAASETASSELNVTALPWYLQVEPPTHIAPLQPPPLPEIPSDAPPLIRSLLEYASEEMGLDDLSLLDLRRLDPPPALGANLFMLFGTARSERHLNVAAGRLVRWLRAKHHVHADADGLLGPNERKTKLRRKAKRAKLLGTMGTDDADDGIRTGWICVNLGSIGRGGPESSLVGEDGRVSGFGIASVGSSVVFQVMTEERRAEMDLETLWTRALHRCISPPSHSSSTGGDDGEALVPVARSKSGPDSVEKAILAGLHRPSAPPNGRQGKSRGLSPLNQARFYSTELQAPAVATEFDPLNTSSAEQLTHVLTYDAQQKQRLLGLLLVQLSKMSSKEARLALGRNLAEPTTFMQLSKLAMETLPPYLTWEFRLAVQYRACALELAWALDSLDPMRSLIMELRLHSVEATRQQYFELLSCILFARESRPGLVVNCATDVIRTMHQRGEAVMVTDLLVTLIEGASRATKKDARQLVARLEYLLFMPRAECLSEEMIMRLMTAHAHMGRWDRIWFTWDVPARHKRPRSAKLYLHLFELAQASQSVKICTWALRRCVPEARNEELPEPVFSYLEVRLAAMACIRVADPRAQEFAEEIPIESRGHLQRLVQREFVKLWRGLMANDVSAYR